MLTTDRRRWRDPADDLHSHRSNRVCAKLMYLSPKPSRSGQHSWRGGLGTGEWNSISNLHEVSKHHVTIQTAELQKIPHQCMGYTKSNPQPHLQASTISHWGLFATGCPESTIRHCEGFSKTMGYHPFPPSLPPLPIPNCCYSVIDTIGAAWVGVSFGFSSTAESGLVSGFG